MALKSNEWERERERERGREKRERERDRERDRERERMRKRGREGGRERESAGRERSSTRGPSRPPGHDPFAVSRDFVCDVLARFCFQRDFVVRFQRDCATRGVVRTKEKKGKKQARPGHEGGVCKCIGAALGQRNQIADSDSGLG